MLIDYRKLNEQLEAGRDEAVAKDETEGSLPGDADASILGAYLGIYPMQVNDWQPLHVTYSHDDRSLTAW